MPRSPWRSVSAVAGVLALLFATAGLLTFASPAAAATHQIQITDSAFGSPVLTVQVGDTVTWSNVDDRPHTVTSEDGTFDSGNMDEGATFSVIFTEPGTHAYLCEYHPDMRATIVVEAAPAATASAAPAAGGSTAPEAGAGTDHQPTGAGHQPDTALPVEASLPTASLLLWGLGLLVIAIGVLPSRRRGAVVTARPPGGWRR